MTYCLVRVLYTSIVSWSSSFRLYVFFVFKQKTAYEMRISDWSSDVCSSDLHDGRGKAAVEGKRSGRGQPGETEGLTRRRHRQHAGRRRRLTQIGRASCRERVCQYV